MSFNEERRTYYFADKAHADVFAQGVRARCRIDGQARVRKTLASRKIGNALYVDSKHADGYSVSVKPFSYADTIDIATRARQDGAIPAPHDH